MRSAAARALAPFGVACVMAAAPAAAGAPARAPADTLAAPAAAARTASLHRVGSAILPPDGLLLVELAGESGQVDYPVPAGAFVQGSLQALRLRLAYGTPGLWLTGELPTLSWSAPAGTLPSGGGGLGDARWGATLALPSPLRDLALAARAGATLPTGARSEGRGEDGVVPEASVAATLRLWRDSVYPELRLHLNAGRRWNPDGGRWHADGADPPALYAPGEPLYPAVAAGGAPGENDFTLLGAAAELRAAGVSLFLEFTEARLPTGRGAAVREFPRFLTPGLHWGEAEGWGLSAAFDVSLSRDDPATAFAPVLPDLTYRLAVSRTLALGGRDRDGDGVPDRRDACPDDREDHDGWQDGDGCPDLDNDGDGVPDALDGAPDRAEDRDGFADEDGIPDPDNDGDGVPDLRDGCPDEPEDFDGDQDGDGCPEERRDSDGDGVPDERDRCPSLAEDLDGFEDADGCPDPDNDLDGIDDARDGCPDAPEDYDGTDDDDGCPDPPPAAPPAGAAPPDTTGVR